MKVPRGTIQEMLHERGEHDAASGAETRLPVEVDTTDDAAALNELGLDEQAVRGYLDDHPGEVGAV